MASKVPYSAMLLALIAADCSSDDRPPLRDTAVDTAAPDGSPGDAAHDADGGVALTLPPGDDGHADVGAALSAGQVRAGRVRAAAQLLSGVKVEGRVGDFKLYNERVAFIIQDARPSDGFTPFGGELLDAMRLLPRADSLYGELALAVGTRIIAPKTVGVVHDGSDGEAALVRVIGEPASLPHLAEVVGGGLGGAPPVHLVIDYILAPDSDTLEMRWRLFNATHKEVNVPLTLLGLSAGDGLRFFAEGIGFVDKPDQVQDHIFLTGEAQAPGYLLYVPDVPLKPLIEFEGLMVMSSGALQVPAAGEVQRSHFLALTSSDPEAGLSRLRQLKGEEQPAAVSGVVRDASAQVVPGARVHVQRLSAAEEPSYATMARTDASGSYTLFLPPGTYAMQAIAEGHGRTEPVALTQQAQPQTRDLTVGDTATLRYAITDDHGAVLPAKLILARTPPLDPLPASFGEQSYPSGAALVIVTPTGQGEVALPPGQYAATAARGFEYELASALIELAAGQTQDASFELIRSVDTRDHICGDFHLHATWSPDANDRYEEKVTWLAGVGVELAVITEHDYVGDFAPHIAKLGLERWLTSLSGVEVSTVVFGHFNAFPLTPDPSRPNQGAPVWFDRTPAELFAEIRAIGPDVLLQVNHPRSPSIVGYLNAIGYDPSTGEADKIPDWSRDFDMIEVFNGKSPIDYDWTAEIATHLQDWFSLLDRGLLAAGTGNSDAHNALQHDPGYPRNCLRTGTDDPSTLTAQQIVAALKAQRVVISGGPFITASVGEAYPGDVAPAPDGTDVPLVITVQAPSWMVVDTLRVFVGGVEQHVVTLDASTADPANPAMRYQGTLLLTAAQDTYAVVTATGKTAMSPVSNQDRPFAVTNPIYLDVDGNGRYDPPESF